MGEVVCLCTAMLLYNPAVKLQGAKANVNTYQQTKFNHLRIKKIRNYNNI
jgi:hypothetical protein